jgi:tape measure domain-containing protein
VSETLTWVFKGVDLLSGPARRGSAAADDLRRALGGASGSVNGLGRAASGLTESLGTGVRAMGALGGAAAGVLAIAGSLGVAFAGVAATIGRSVIEMVRFRESAVVTLGTLMRAPGEGRGAIGRVGGAAFRQTQAIARLTPGNERDVIGARTQLAAGGFRGADEERVLAASLDVGALNPNDSTAQSRFVRALSQIRGRGKLQAEELNQLGELGVGRGDVFAAIARQRGMTGTATENQRRIEGMMQRGQITGEEGTNAALSAVQGMTGERLGGFARLQGGTLSGSLSNLEESIFGLVTGINQLENLPGVRAFSRSISAIGNALNGSSEAGQKLQRSVGLLISEAAGMFAGVFTPARIEGFVTTLANVLPPMFEAMKLVGGAFVQGLGRALGPLIDRMSSFSSDDSQQLLAFALSLADAFGYLVGVSVQVVAGIAALGAGITVIGAEALRWVQWFLGLPAQFGTLATQGWMTLGSQMVDGLVGGLTSGAARVGDAVRGLASNAITTARETLGIASPSRVFAEIGGYTAEGYERGIRGGTAGAQDAAAAMVAPPGGAGAGGAMAGRGVFQVFIDGAGREASAIVDEIESRMGVGFDRLALSGGEVL